MSKQEKKALLPALRFPKFQDLKNWEEKKLKNVCEINPTTKNLPDNFIYIDLESVEAGNLLQKKFIRLEDAPSRAQRLLKSGDIIFQMVRPYQRNNLLFISEDILNYVASTGYAQLRAYQSNKYLYQYVHTDQFVNRVISKCTGSSYPAINSNDLSEIIIEIPQTEEEQQKIADCLSSIDELIIIQTQKLTIYKNHKKGLMQQLFPAEGEAVPKLRFHEFKDMRGWTESTLGEAATFINGRAFRQEELLDQGQYRVLRVGNFFSNNEWYYSDLKLDENKYCDNGDLLYAWSASFGPRIWKGEKVIYHYHIWKVIPNVIIAKDFLYTLLENETIKIKKQSANGLGLLHITKNSIENWICRFPTVEEQRKIAKCLSSIDELITAQTQKIELLKRLKKGLMQQLFPSIDEISE